ncbi:hypothetical protein IVB03_27845 [Bradyrhizobium sp. 168]|uniref:hypothetical protein n=1 Tax=Bradyrhizobium sp. 168 TaxID=2782639 RepID=UPI001FF9CDC8|nr:hypothetical protein [Bradyrhizobium sp. 168]MCK1583273.1 hypothetical protein [Bradyrhizobium sp. 168]
MADIQEAVRRLTIQTTAPGADAAAKSLGDVSKAMDGVTVSSSSTEKATLSLDQKFASLEKRYVAGVAAQAQYEKTQRLVNQAVAQNPALQDRANAILSAAKDRHDQLTNSQKALGIVTSDLNARVQASAGSFGVVGNALTALGPYGLAAAATIGTLVAALNFASDAAHHLADKAKSLREFAESTGLTTQQVQALSSEAGKFGIDSDTLSGGLQKFTAGFQQLRLGTGDLLTQIRRINPALADQIQGAQDAATAFTLFGRAVAQTDNIFQRNALLKAGLGKGSAIFGAFFETAPDVSALTNAFATAGKGIDDNMIKKLAQLQVEIDKTNSAASKTFASIFAVPVLEGEKQYASLLLEIAKAMKEISQYKFPEAPDWVKSAAGIAGKAALNIVPQIGMAVEGAGYIRSGVSKLAAANDARSSSMANFQSPANSYSAFQAPGAAANSNSASAALTLDAQAAKLKDLVGVLGSAATPAQRLAANIAELGVKARDAGLGEDVLAKATSGLRLENAIALQSQHNSALGAAASTADVLKLKTLELARAQQQGVGLTQAQIDNQKRLTVEQNLGITQIKASADAYTLEAQTIGMTTGDAVAFAAVQNKINEARRNGQVLTQDNIDAITREAQSLGKAAKSAETLRFGYDTLTSIGQSFSQNLRNGQNAWDAFKNAGLTALGSIADRLAKMATDNLWSAAFGGSSSGGGILGLLGLGGGSGAVNANGSIFGAVGPTSVGGAPLVGLHSGGIVGSEATFTRNVVDMSAFSRAHRYHTGGIAGDEVPIIAKRGEGVFTQGQMAALGRGGGEGSSGVHVSVAVTVDDDGKLQAYVKNVSQATTVQGIGAYAASPKFVEHVGAASSKARSRRL